MSASTYVGGALLSLVVLGSCCVAAMTVVARRAPWTAGVERALAVFLTGSAALVASLLVPGLVGILTRGTWVAAALLIAAAAWRFVPAAEGDRDPPPPAPASASPVADPAASVGLALTGVVLAAGGALAYLSARSVHQVAAVDSLTVHLPAVARWIQSGSLWPIVQYAPDLSNGTYPENGTLMQLAAVLPWHSTFLVRYVDAPFVLAMAVAVFAVARELGAPRTAAVLAGAATTTLTAVAFPAFEQAQVDAPMLAWFAAGALFLIRAARSGRAFDLVLAGLGLGLAFGAKWYAVAYVPLLVVAWLVATRPPLRRVGLLAGVIAAAGGFWLLRNWIKTGNPVMPADVPVLFDSPATRQAEFGFTVSDYLFDGDVWGDWLWPAWRDQFGLLGPILVAALAAALVLARRAPRAVLVTALATGAMLLVYLFMPDSAFGPEGEPRLVGVNSRYAVPGLLGAAVLAAWLARRWRLALEGLLLAGVVDGALRAYPDVAFGDVARAAAALVGLGVAVWVAANRRPRSVVLVAAAVLVLVAGGWKARQRATLERYAQFDPTIAYVTETLPSGSRVAFAKTWNNRGVPPVLPAFGPRLENRVDYMGRFRDGLLRATGEREPFLAQLRAGDYDALVIGTGLSATPGGEEPEAGWARSAGYREVARTDRLVAFAR